MNQTSFSKYIVYSRIWDSHSGDCEELYHQDITPCNLVITLLDLLFQPEDGNYMLLRNVGWFSPDYTVLYPRWHTYSRCRYVCCGWGFGGNDSEEHSLRSPDCLICIRINVTCIATHHDRRTLRWDSSAHLDPKSSASIIMAETC
jgi:hypothetical protein